MSRRRSAAALAALVLTVTVASAFTEAPTPPGRPDAKGRVSPDGRRVTRPVADGRGDARDDVRDDAVNIDWRVLAGLDYSNGKATDTLKKLEGKVVRIPGFVVPLDDFQEEGAEFLLVPYYGACVHTPPPPPNQIVMVEMTGKKAIKLNLFDAVWMSGKLKIASVESPYGTVGYQLEGLKVEPYSSK